MCLNKLGILRIMCITLLDFTTSQLERTVKYAATRSCAAQFRSMPPTSDTLAICSLLPATSGKQIGRMEGEVAEEIASSESKSLMPSCAKDGHGVCEDKLVVAHIVAPDVVRCCLPTIAHVTTNFIQLCTKTDTKVTEDLLNVNRFVGVLPL